MIETKFKQTELGPIPVDWAISLIADLGDYGLNNTLSRDNLSYDVGRIKNIHYGDILTIYDNYIDCAKDCLPLIIPSKEPKNKFYLYSGDLIIADTAEDETVGKACEIINIDDRLVVSGLHTIVFRPKSAFAPKFLGYTFNATFHHNSLLPLMQGTKVISITKRGLNGISLAYPPNISEQEQIAEALSDVDDLIYELDALIEKKRAIFQGSMQELLTGNHRLPGFSVPWKHIIFGDTVNIYRGGSPRPIENFITTNPNGLNWIKIGDVRPKDKYIVHTAEKIIPEGLSSTREVHVGDFILSNSMSFGRPYILKIDGCIHDGWLAITNYESTFDKDYLYYLLGSYSVFKQYLCLAAGSGVLNLNKKLVASVELDIPEIAEQQAIATILSDMDAEIAELDAKREKYASIRQGMMQQLLTGKIRLI